VLFQARAKRSAFAQADNNSVLLDRSRYITRPDRGQERFRDMADLHPKLGSSLNRRRETFEAFCRPRLTDQGSGVSNGVERLKN
jgi:hypothetical protein